MTAVPTGLPERTIRRQGSTPQRFEAALELLDTLTRQLLQETVDDERRALVARVRDLHADLREGHPRQRQARLAGVHKALEGLREVGSVAGLIERTPQVLTATLGFDRVLISQVRESTCAPLKLHVRGDPAAGDAILAAAGKEAEQLTHRTFESEILRRRVPLRVPDVQSTERVPRRLAVLSDWRSYVAAPIMPEDDVVGLLHADYRLRGHDTDDFDRDLLAAFAAGFGQLLRAAALHERLQIQAGHVRAAMATLNLEVSELTSSETGLTTQPIGPTTIASPQRVHPLSPGGRLETLLTPREWEVMRLLSTGARNPDIATRLGISEGTVKSHVKHILRKLSATTRAEAVSKYMRLAALSQATSPPASLR